MSQEKSEVVLVHREQRSVFKAYSSVTVHRNSFGPFMPSAFLDTAAIIFFVSCFETESYSKAQNGNSCSADEPKTQQLSCLILSSAELQVGVATPGLGLGDLSYVSWDDGRVQGPKTSSQLETLSHSHCTTLQTVGKVPWTLLFYIYLWGACLPQFARGGQRTNCRACLSSYHVSSRD